MRVTWSHTARAWVKQEAASIRRERPIAADRWLERMEAAVSRLTLFPFSGRTVPEYPDAPVREVVTGGYRIIYEVKPDRVRIVQVLHSRQLFQLSHTSPDLPE